MARREEFDNFITRRHRLSDIHASHAPSRDAVVPFREPWTGTAWWFSSW